MKKIIVFFTILLFFNIVPCHSILALLQKNQPTITIPKISNPPKIDAVLDDECWSIATKVTDFYQYQPVDGEPISEKTEAFLAYDRENLYVAFRCFDSEIEKIRSYLSKRDTLIGEDRVGIALDTFNSQRRAYGFEANAFGVQMDYSYLEGKGWDVNLDMIYDSDGRINDDSYIVEMAIPFKSLRFPPGDVYTIGVSLYRLIIKNNDEWSLWPAWTRDKNTYLDQHALITDIEGIEYSRNIEILPSFTALQTGSLSNEGVFENESPDSDFGISLKYGVTPNITADFTYNPDFSQVEADVGQVDINQRYELYYPEKRPFFLEGADIFKTDIEAFYSRRIIDPLYGAKITGKVGNVTFGFISSLDEGPGRRLSGKDNPYLGEKSLFNIFRGAYDLFGNSYIGFLMTSRQFAKSSNQVVGFDGLFNFKQKYRFSFQGLGSFTTTHEGEKLRAPAFKAEFSRESRHLSYSCLYRDLYPDFRTDAGFIKRTDIREGAMNVGYRFFPDISWIVWYNPNYEFSRMYDHNGIMVEQRGKGSINFEFKNNINVDISFENGMEQWVGIDFDKNLFNFSLDIDPTNYFSGKFIFTSGDSIYYHKENPYLGYARFLQSQITFRPDTHLTEDFIFTKSTFWQEKGVEQVYDYNILRSKTTYHFTRRLFLRTILEYNTYWKELSTDILLSYMYNYGTVLFVGYGGLFDRDENMHFRQNQRTFFIKLSYLWRL